MPATASAPRRKRADVRRREIADAALRVIAEQGLGRFTALAIAQEIGVSDAALFRHFATKEEIVMAAIDQVEEMLFESAPLAEGDALQRLGAFIQGRVATISAHPGVARLILSEDLARAAPPAGVKRVAAFRQRTVELVRELLAEAARQGLLGVALPEAQVVVYGALMALAHAPHLAAPGEDVARLAPRVWSALEPFLRHGPAAAGPVSRRSPRGGARRTTR